MRITRLLLTAALAALPVSAWGAERLSLNEATAAQLAGLAAVDDDAAAAIVDLREDRDGLGSVEELRVLRLEDAALTSLRDNTWVEFSVPATASVKTYKNADEVLAEFSGEPSVQQVQAWANHYARTSPNMVRRWLSQASAFAALPQLQLEYQLDDDWDQDFDYLNEAGAEALTPDEKVFAALRSGGAGQGRTYKVKAKWELQELIMSNERIRVISEAQDVVKLRDTTLSEVTRLYFERRRLQAEMLLSPKSDPLGQVKDQLRLMEMTAHIDALTGGAFSQAVAR